MAGRGSDEQIARACAWIEPQRVCTIIGKHHGSKGLQRVLKGIAQACSVKKIPMLPRVRAVAEFYELEVY